MYLHRLSCTFTDCLVPSQTVLYLHRLSYTFTDCLVPSQTVLYLHRLSYTFTDSPMPVQRKSSSCIQVNHYILHTSDNTTLPLPLSGNRTVLLRANKVSDLLHIGYCLMGRCLREQLRTPGIGCRLLTTPPATSAIGTQLLIGIVICRINIAYR